MLPTRSGEAVVMRLFFAARIRFQILQKAWGRQKLRPFPTFLNGIGLELKSEELAPA